LYHYKSNSEDEMDEYSAVIAFAPDATIDFVGTPLTGTSPLAVQFTDLSVVNHAISTWDFGDGNTVSYAGQTHPLNTYTTDACSIALL
jgi:PKD repeat protein